MNKKDMMELRRRITKEDCTFSKMSGCYVNNDGEKVLTFNETFLNLKSDEMNRYLDIAKKVTGGKLGNNVLELGFLPQEDKSESRQSLLMGIKESGLKNPELLDCLYDLIIDNYEYTGNYLILLYHDVYDVMTKTSDNMKVDESVEMYEYIICAICPVKLTKPGLGYLKDENRIGNRIRDWVVSSPENGFLYPAFTERSSDFDSLMYYAKSAKEPKADFMSEGLGCMPRQTKTEQKITFQSILDDVLGEEGETCIANINKNINEMVELTDKEDPPVVMNKEILNEVMNESGVPHEKIPEIERAYTGEFNEEVPIAEDLLDKKIIKKLEEKRIKEEKEEKLSYGVILKTTSKIENMVKKQIIDGQTCVVIPIDDEKVKLNGNDLI